MEDFVVDIAAKKLAENLNSQLDAGILEEIVSLFNNGILSLRTTTPKHTFDENNSKLTVEQCFRVDFEGKNKIKELERKFKIAIDSLESLRYDRFNNIEEVNKIIDAALEMMNDSDNKTDTD